MRRESEDRRGGEHESGAERGHERQPKPDLHNVERGQKLRTVDDGLSYVRVLMKQMEQEGEYEGGSLWNVARINRDMKGALDDKFLDEERDGLVDAMTLLAHERFRITNLDEQNMADELSSSDPDFAQDVRISNLNQRRASALFDQMASRYRSTVDFERYSRNADQAFNDLLSVSERLDDNELLGNVGARIEMFLDLFKDSGLANEGAIVELDSIIESLADQMAHTTHYYALEIRNAEMNDLYADEDQAAAKLNVSRALPLLRDLSVIRDEVVKHTFGSIKSPSEVAQLVELKRAA